jgi:high-affinity Fe2+/Pb2+ permease
MIATGLLILGAIVGILAGLLLTLLVIDMFQHPGGMGIEMVLGPIIGLVALGLFVMAGYCLYAAGRVARRRAAEQPSSRLNTKT